jgi:hypothetical protein
VALEAGDERVEDRGQVLRVDGFQQRHPCVEDRLDLEWVDRSVDGDDVPLGEPGPFGILRVEDLEPLLSEDRLGADLGVGVRGDVTGLFGEDLHLDATESILGALDLADASHEDPAQLDIAPLTEALSAVLEISECADGARLDAAGQEEPG